MSDKITSNKFSESIYETMHDIECLSNEIKFAIPSLITRIEYNKFVNNLGNGVFKTDVEFEKVLLETISFLEHLKRFAKVR